MAKDDDGSVGPIERRRVPRGSSQRNPPAGAASARLARCGDTPMAAATIPIGDAVLPHRNDGELIRLCERLVAIEAEETELLRRTAHDGGWETAIEASTQEWRAIESRIYSLGGPTSPDGLRAVAQAVLATADKGPDGNFACRDLRTWLALALARYFAEGAWA